ncbi:valine--tRNA ligase, mitochondrial 1-like [Eucalyptus grandis]|uniref:valine--tRNA ligase, mitochondrial 1-like n=1 Tax=Eucalyptus grandis TaxID=71139 RepID=UPI00192EF389|nr:valine--tRNA ligase, mitochondrial 1-like [Eucalyptus grandis]
MKYIHFDTAYSANMIGWTWVPFFFVNFVMYLIFFNCCSLFYLTDSQVLLSEKDVPASCAFENVNENLKVYLKVQGELNAEAEREKIKNKMEEIQKQQEKLKKIINSSVYEQKVPVHIQEENAAKLAKLIQEFEFLQKESSRLEAIDECN